MVDRSARVCETRCVDPEFEGRWRDGRKPFDGRTLVTPLITIDLLLAVARTVVMGLRAQRPAASLRTLDDWHEHDGYVTSTEPASWDDVEAAIANKASFIEWTSDDDFVRRAWRDSDGTFYLRWFRYDESIGTPPPDYPPVGGSLDLTGATAMVEALSCQLDPLDVGIQIVDPVAYFTDGWSG